MSAGEPDASLPSSIAAVAFPEAAFVSKAELVLGSTVRQWQHLLIAIVPQVLHQRRVWVCLRYVDSGAWSPSIGAPALKLSVGIVDSVRGVVIDCSGIIFSAITSELGVIMAFGVIQRANRSGLEVTLYQRLSLQQDPPFPSG